MPDFKIEKSVQGIVCGIDEAGRGPLAGPVVAAAVIFEKRRLPRELSAGLDDSKKLPAKRREYLFGLLGDCGAARIGVGVASVEEIDRINILRATHLAMERAAAELGVLPDVALIDGNQAPRSFCCPTRCVVKGDGLSLSIAAASIVAKVTRDRLMATLAVEFPGYGWEHNAGYGTEEHREAIRRLGPTPHHRRSFALQGDLFADLV